MTPLGYASKKELILDALEEEILTGRLQAGTLLRQEELAQRYGVSITPVREALRELGARGLVEHEVHRGVRVAQAGVEGQEELAEIRALLEPYAARLATPRVSDADLEQLERLNERMRALLGEDDLRDIRRLNYDFHMVVYEAAGTLHLLPLIRSAWTAHEWLRLVVPARAVQAVAEHDAILEALRARDAERVERLMRDHLGGDTVTVHEVRAKRGGEAG